MNIFNQHFRVRISNQIFPLIVFSLWFFFDLSILIFHLILNTRQQIEKGSIVFLFFLGFAVYTILRSFISSLIQFFIVIWLIISLLALFIKDLFGFVNIKIHEFMKSLAFDSFSLITEPNYFSLQNSTFRTECFRVITTF